MASLSARMASALQPWTPKASGAWLQFSVLLRTLSKWMAPVFSANSSFLECIHSGAPGAARLAVETREYWHRRRHSLHESFFIHHVGHLGEVSPVVPFQHVDQSLHTASGHAFSTPTCFHDQTILWCE